MEMTYRRLGRSGLKVSVLSFGSWVSFGPQLDVGRARDCLAAAHDAGVNFFDNAEAYAGGESEHDVFNTPGYEKFRRVVNWCVEWRKTTIALSHLIFSGLLSSMLLSPS